jgi:hypothetical protein
MSSFPLLRFWTLGAVAAACVVGASADAAPGAKTLGFVLTDWHLAMPESKDAKECPQGFQYDNNQQWAAQFPTEAAQRAVIAKYYHRQNRGPQGENAWYNPGLVKDPLPFRELQSKIAVGMNLDGSDDGAATAKTCKHEKFIGDDGTAAVDNQLFRVFGCQKGMRKSGFFDEFHNHSIRVDPINRILVEVTGVDDELNDPDVEVTTYKGENKLVEDGDGKVLPWQSQRVDEQLSPYYFSHTHGKIVEGVLITDPVDINWQHKLGIGSPSHYKIEGMRLRLKLSPNGADGIMAGYYDIPQFWEVYSKNAQAADWLASASGPSVWAAITRYADGDKDATGHCNAISMAQGVAFARAFIVHPGKNEKAVVSVAATPASER